MPKSVISEHSEKRGAYPFIGNFAGNDVVVTSNAHRKELMKQHGMHDDVKDSFRSQRRKINVQEKDKERQAILKDGWMRAKHGQADLHSLDRARKKRQWEERQRSGPIAL